MTDSKQGGLWDVDLTTPELEAAVEALEANREARKAYVAAQRTIKEAISSSVERIKDVVGADAYASGGARVRIGNRTAPVGRREGGDIAIEPWTREASVLGRFEPIE